MLRICSQSPWKLVKRQHFIPKCMSALLFHNGQPHFWNNLKPSEKFLHMNLSTFHPPLTLITNLPGAQLKKIIVKQGATGVSTWPSKNRSHYRRRRNRRVTCPTVTQHSQSATTWGRPWWHFPTSRSRLFPLLTSCLGSAFIWVCWLQGRAGFLGQGRSCGVGRGLGGGSRCRAASKSHLAHGPCFQDCDYWFAPGSTWYPLVLTPQWHSRMKSWLISQKYMYLKTMFPSNISTHAHLFTSRPEINWSYLSFFYYFNYNLSLSFGQGAH